MTLSQNFTRLRLNAAVLAPLVIAIAMAGCDSRTSRSAASKNEPSASKTERAGGEPGIVLNCVLDRLNNPPESFHYVYKKIASERTDVDQEADVTPQTIDGVRRQADGSPQPIHGVRSDPQSWRGAIAGLTGIAGMSGTVSTFNHSAAMQRESDGGSLNGYQTIHYSIDTARWDETTRQMLGSVTLGPGGFDKGDVWVTADGCPVKLVLDEEMHKKDGSLLERLHFEEAMSKKS
jgi:hypothetical protein